MVADVTGTEKISLYARYQNVSESATTQNSDSHLSVKILVPDQHGEIHFATVQIPPGSAEARTKPVQCQFTKPDIITSQLFLSLEQIKKIKLSLEDNTRTIEFLPRNYYQSGMEYSLKITRKTENVFFAQIVQSSTQEQALEIKESVSFCTLSIKVDDIQQILTSQFITLMTQTCKVIAGDHNLQINEMIHQEALPLDDEQKTSLTKTVITELSSLLSGTITLNSKDPESVTRAYNLIKQMLTDSAKLRTILFNFLAQNVSEDDLNKRFLDILKASLSDSNPDTEPLLQQSSGQFVAVAKQLSELNWDVEALLKKE